MTYRLGIDVGGHATNWVAFGQEGDNPLASGTVDSVVALIDGELRAGSHVAVADPARVDTVTTDFAQRLGDVEPMMVGGTPYGAESLVGHLVASVVIDARSKLGSEPGAVVLVHDDDLDDYRRSLWAEAGRLAGIPLTQLTLLSRTEALGQAVAAEGGGASAAAGAAKIGWERHPDLPGPASGLAGGSLGAAAGAGAAVAGGGILAATVLGGGEAIAAGPAIAAAPGATGSPLSGPVGSPLSAPAGPTGTPLPAPAGPTGTPLSSPAGPTGSPLSAGPTGTPIATTVTKTVGAVVKRSYRIPIIAASIVAAGLVATVAVLAAGGDDPVAAPPATLVVEVTDAVTDVTAAPTATESAVVASTLPASTSPASIAPACTLGSWTMQNDSFAAMWLAMEGEFASSEGLAGILVSVIGVVAVEVDADGVWTSTYSDWGFTAIADDVTITMSITGSDKSSGTFAQDGSFTFVDTDLNTVATMTASADGVELPIPAVSGTRSVFSGAGSYVCEGDTMTISVDGNPGAIEMIRAA